MFLSYRYNVVSCVNPASPTISILMMLFRRNTLQRNTNCFVFCRIYRIRVGHGVIYYLLVIIIINNA